MSENSDVHRAHGAGVKINTRNRKRTYTEFVPKSLGLCGIWIGHPLRRIFLLQHVIEVKIEGKIDVTGSGGRRLSSY